MRRNYCRFVSCLVLLFVTLLSIPATNYPQAKAEEEGVYIVLRINTPKGNSAKIWVLDGEMTTIVDEKTGVGYGFVPVVENLEARTISVRTFEVVKTASETTVGKEVASTGMKLGAQKQFDYIPFTVKAIAIVWDVKDPKLTSRPTNIPGLMLATCCIDCNGETVCARCAFTDCGCCCIRCN